MVLNPEDAKENGMGFSEDHPHPYWSGKWEGPLLLGCIEANPEINYIGIDIQKSDFKLCFR